MSQKSSVPQAISFVSQVLKRDRAVFGLTCSKYQSGEIDRSGRISRCGEPAGAQPKAGAISCHGTEESCGVSEVDV
jgi:hypothetical protein